MEWKIESVLRIECSQVRAKIEALSNPKRILLDSQYNMCHLAKSKHILQNSKAFLRSRVNITLACPFRKGSYWVDLGFNVVNDTIPAMKTIGELKRMVPTISTQTTKTRVNIFLTAFTKVGNMLMTAGTLNFTNVELSELLRLGI